MGEIADAIRHGTLCKTCGTYIGLGNGYPRTCSACTPKFECPDCKKTFKSRHSYNMHWDAKHSGVAKE